MFKLGDLKHAIESLGEGQHSAEAIMDVLEPRLGGKPTSDALAKAMAQLERRGWIHVHDGRTVEMR